MHCICMCNYKVTHGEKPSVQIIQTKSVGCDQNTKLQSKKVEVLDDKHTSQHTVTKACFIIVSL